MSISALNTVRLERVERNGTLPGRREVSGRVQEICRMGAEHFEKVGFCPPWVGYIAFAGETPVGACAFKTPPKDGAVEISYATFEEFREQGYATAMVQGMIDLASGTDANVAITAHTLPGNSASTGVLTKLGFVRVGDVMHPEDGMVSEWRLL